jgi:hypothetical protein
VPRSSEAADGLHPAEDFPDALSRSLADGVARAPSAPAIDGRPTAGVGRLRHVRRDAQFPTAGDEAGHVVALVGADGEASRPSSRKAAEHLQSGASLGKAIGWLDLQVDEQPMPFSTSSLRTEYSAISSMPFSSRSGGIEGRPTLLYIASNVGESAAKAPSAKSFSLHRGWSDGTRSAGVLRLNIDVCFVTSPRIGASRPHEITTRCGMSIPQRPF